MRGKKFKMTLDGFEARVFQHEYDHLDRVLFHDRMTDEVRGSVQGELDALIDAHPARNPRACERVSGAKRVSIVIKLVIKLRDGILLVLRLSCVVRYPRRFVRSSCFIGEIPR